MTICKTAPRGERQLRKTETGMREQQFQIDIAQGVRMNPTTTPTGHQNVFSDGHCEAFRSWSYRPGVSRAIDWSFANFQKLSFLYVVQLVSRLHKSFRKLGTCLPGSSHRIPTGFPRTSHKPSKALPGASQKSTRREINLGIYISRIIGSPILLKGRLGGQQHALIPQGNSENARVLPGPCVLRNGSKRRHSQLTKLLQGLIFRKERGLLWRVQKAYSSTGIPARNSTQISHMNAQISACIS